MAYSRVYMVVSLWLIVAVDQAAGYIYDDRYVVIEFNPFLNKETAKTFATSIRHRRNINCDGLVTPTPVCSNEQQCECNKALCQMESDREHYCIVLPCQSDKLCYLTVPCPEHFETGCTDGIDIVFVLDESISQGDEGFRRQKDYVIDFIARSPVGSSYTRIAIVTYSFTPTVHFWLNSTYDSTTLQKGVANLTSQKGASNLHLALKEVREKLFSAGRGGMRIASHKYAVILSDGLSSNLVAAQEEAAKLRQAVVSIVAVGMGDQIWHQELWQITSDDKMVFPSITKDAFNFINFHYTIPRCTTCDMKTSDVAFVMDASTDLMISDFYNQIDNMRQLAKATPISEQGTHVSYTRYGKNVHVEFGFDLHYHQDPLIAALSNVARLKQVMGPTNTTKVLEHFLTEGFSSSRSEVRRIMVLFSNGHFGDLDLVTRVANDLKAAGVIIAAVGAGASANMTSLLNIASDPAFVYILGDDVYTETSTINTLKSSFEFYECMPNDCIW